MSFGGLRLHTTNLISGAMFIVLGVVFIAYEGTSALGGLYEGAEELALAAQQRMGGFSGLPAALATAAIALALGAALIRRYVRRRDGKAAGR